VIIREVVMLRDGDGGNHEDERHDTDMEGKGKKGGHKDQEPIETQVEEEPTPQLQLQQPASFEMGDAFSSAQIPFDSTFLQSFSNLQVEVADLQDGYTNMR